MIWTVVVSVWFQILSQYLPKWTEKNHKITKAEISIWDMNQGSSDHEAVVLTSWLQHFAAKKLWYSKIANIEQFYMKV